MPQDHGADFDAMCAQIAQQLQQSEWRQKSTPRLVAVLEGVQAGLEHATIFRACRIMYEDYGPVRLCNKVLFRLFTRMLR